MLAGALGLGAVFVRSDLLAFTMIALAWIVPLPDIIDYSLLPLAVVGVVVFAIAVRRARSREFGIAGVAMGRLMSSAGRRG
jgi:hypothetical protein